MRPMRLPHQLVAAFHATLEEVTAADLLVHVMDASAPDRDRRRQAVQSVLVEVGAQHVPVLDVFNKIDLVEPLEHFQHLQAALLGPALLDAIAGRLALDAERVHLSLDSSSAADRRLLSDIYRHGRVVNQTNDNDRVAIEADIPRRLLSRFAHVTVPA